jgi:dTDP-4-amino-4,6-dideoxygalactose transaminase
LPAYSCYDLVSASVGAGAKLVFYDVDPDTLSPDLDSLKAAILRGARTVVVGNLFGFPLPWTGIRELCRDAEAMVVEDFAQGLGSTWEGSPGGSFGDLTVISFGRGKGWAGGGGGALLIRTGDPGSSIGRVGLAPPPFGADLKGVLMSTFQWLFGRPSLFWIPSLVPGLGLGETRFKDPRIPTDIPAFSATLASLAAEEAWVEVLIRRENAERLRELMSDAAASGELRVPRPLAGGEAGFLRFPVLELRAPGLLRQSDRARALGIFPGYPRPLADLPQGRALHLTPGGPDFPGASSLAEHLVTLPTHRLLVERDFKGLLSLLGSMSQAGIGRGGASGA